MNKKELIFQYKNTPRAAGVYQIRNSANGRVLVGASLNLEGRASRFKFEQAQGGLHTNPELKRDWDQFGPEAFSFEILEELKPSEDPRHDYRPELAELEKKWLEKIQPYGERGYNSLPR